MTKNMTKKMMKNIVVIGQGAAGLSAALAAAEAARAKNIAGENHSAWTKPQSRTPAATPAGRRPICAWPRSIASSHLRPRHARGDKIQRRRNLFRHARRAGPRHGAMDRRATAWAFHQPVYYLAKGPPRIQPVGGGETIHRELSRAARDAGVVFRHWLCGGCADRWATAGIVGRASSRPARRCPPTPRSSPAAASRPTPR